jgi:hypothetical protein
MEKGSDRLSANLYHHIQFSRNSYSQLKSIVNNNSRLNFLRQKASIDSAQGRKSFTSGFDLSLGSLETPGSLGRYTDRIDEVWLQIEANILGYCAKIPI